MASGNRERSYSWNRGGTQRHCLVVLFRMPRLVLPLQSQTRKVLSLQNVLYDSKLKSLLGDQLLSL